LEVKRIIKIIIINKMNRVKITNKPLVIDQSELSYNPTRREAPVGIPESPSPFISFSSVPMSVFEQIEKGNSMEGKREHRETRRK